MDVITRKRLRNISKLFVYVFVPDLEDFGKLHFLGGYLPSNP